MSAERDDNVDARAEARRKAEVMLAFADGAEVEVTIDLLGEWTVIRAPLWNWDSCDYRVKPKPREWWEVLDLGGDLAARCETRKDAEYMCRDFEQDGCFGPFTIVHMREVTE